MSQISSIRITGKKLKDKLFLNRIRNKTSQQFFLLIHKVDWKGRRETPAGKAWPREAPQASASAEEIPGLPAGKRVPYVPINDQNYYLQK
ncbi:hypothetical protein CN563_20685 [Bacillus sp. AFS026049]|nr:hypothetical protein CON84_13035 [Bacillus sp. AFS094228]PEO44156.1 hypothetical protein CN563_20685 [Bacillus sp. AFS026049]